MFELLVSREFAESYWGLLSERTISGIPCRANTDLRAQIVSMELSEAR